MITCSGCVNCADSLSTPVAPGPAITHMFGSAAAVLHGAEIIENQGLRFAILGLRLPERSPSSTGLPMAIKKPGLSNSLWERCNEFAARVEAQLAKLGLHS